MLYTRKGDDGTTNTIAVKERFSKSSDIAEALGTMDEINSFVGLCKVKAKGFNIKIGNKEIPLSEILNNVQEKLFIVQAEIAGIEKSVSEDAVKEVEGLIDGIEKELPPIKTFFIAGGDELSAMFDFARTIARRAERRVACINDQKMVKINSITLAYLNRLSSLLYALARIVNHEKGVEEKKPNYK